ncbi:MAG TPA: hypothetical protein DDW65_20550 [Firmicutes bacterium]|jgi:hypothetical protein|nr:hypothetical protein [Bacillota bacterium]
MRASNQIQNNPWIEALRQLITDIQSIAEGESRQVFTDMDQNFKNHRVRIRYSVKELIPENCNQKKLFNGGSKR